MIFTENMSDVLAIKSRPLVCARSNITTCKTNNEKDSGTASKGSSKN